MADHHILFYEYVDDVVERRPPYREAHLERITAARDAGHVVMAGALGAPPHGAAIVFRSVDPELIEAYVNDDPYFQAGLITRWRIEPWNLV